MHLRLLAPVVLAASSYLAPAQTTEVPAATVDINFANQDGTANNATFTFGTATGTPISTRAAVRTAVGEVNTAGPLSLDDVFAVVDPPAGCQVTGGTLTAAAVPANNIGNLFPVQTITIQLTPAGTCGVDFPSNPPDNLAPCTGSQLALGLAPGTTNAFDLTPLAAVASFIGTIDADLTFQPTGTGCAIAPVEAFISFTLVNGNQPVPVQLVAFTGERGSRGDQLAWTAAGEVDLAGYAVERSTDGEDFAEISYLAALGTADGHRDYAYLTDAPFGKTATAYYRLRAVDFDGSAAYSPVVVLGGGPVDRAALGLASNYAPAGEGWTLNDHSDVTHRVQVYSTDGRLVGAYPGAAGGAVGADLPAGLYLLRLGEGTGAPLPAALY